MMNDKRLYITIKDGSKIRHASIVRYRAGATALMRIDRVDSDDFGQRVCGINIIGDYHEAYAHDCMAASEKDMATWHSYSGVRNSIYEREENADELCCAG